MLKKEELQSKEFAIKNNLIGYHISRGGAKQGN